MFNIILNSKLKFDGKSVKNIIPKKQKCVNNNKKLEGEYYKFNDKFDNMCIRIRIFYYIIYSNLISFYDQKIKKLYLIRKKIGTISRYIYKLNFEFIKMTKIDNSKYCIIALKYTINYNFLCELNDDTENVGFIFNGELILLNEKKYDKDFPKEDIVNYINI